MTTPHAKTAEGGVGSTCSTAAEAAADWSSTPHVVLAQVFSYLPVLDRLTASHVASTWRAASCHPLVWRYFDYGVCHHGSKVAAQRERMEKRLQWRHRVYLRIIATHGKKFRRVSVVLCSQESLDVLSRLSEACSSLKCCILEAHRTTRLQYSHVLHQFLSACVGAVEIHLKNVELSGTQPNLPFPIGLAHTGSLRSLSMVNCFSGHNLSSLMYLVRLEQLTVLPHHLRFTWLEHLANAALRTLNIVNMVGVWKFDFPQLSEEAWRRISQSTGLRVHCYLMDVYHSSKLLCPAMPLSTLACCQASNLRFTHLRQVLLQYSSTLTTFVYFSRHERSYHVQRLAAEDHLLAIVQQCLSLRTVALKDRLHSSTLLLMVQLNPNLQEPIIRDDMIQYDLHIPSGVTLPQQVLAFTTENFLRDKFVSAMSQLLRYDWRPLPKEEYFKVLLDRYSSW